MSFVLAGRLLRTGVVPEEDVQSALGAVVLRGVPFIQALSEQGGDVARVLERELARMDAPLIRGFKPVGSLVEALPRGLCARLLAVPVAMDPRTGAVDVAAVDPSDSHVIEELSFHLQAPVRVVRAELGELLVTLQSLDGVGRLSRPPPPPGAAEENGPSTKNLGIEPLPPAPRVPAEAFGGDEPAAAKPSSPPIPLVRKAPASSERGASAAGGSDRPAPRRRGDMNPGLAQPKIQQTFGEDEAGEPVIGLYRSKPPPPPATAGLEVRNSAVPAVRPEDIAPFLQTLGKAETPDGVVDELVAGLSIVAERVAVFAVRGGKFHGRACNAQLGNDEDLREIVIPSNKPSIFGTALQAGYYLGPLPDNDVHRGVVDLFGSPEDEVYATAATVQGHPVLTLLAGGLGDPALATRWADQLARGAGEALGRILKRAKEQAASE